MEINRTDKPKWRPWLAFFFIFSTVVYLLLIWLIMDEEYFYDMYHETFYDFFNNEFNLCSTLMAISFHADVMALTMFIWSKSKKILYTRDWLRIALKIYVFFGAFCSFIGGFIGMLEEDAVFLLFALSCFCHWGAIRLINNFIDIYYLYNDVPLPEKKEESHPEYTKKRRFSSYSGFGSYSGYSGYSDDSDDIGYSDYSSESSYSRSSWPSMTDSYYGKHGEFDTNDRIRANMEDMQQMSHDRGFDPYDHGYDWDEISDAMNDDYL